MLCGWGVFLANVLNNERKLSENSSAGNAIHRREIRTVFGESTVSFYLNKAPSHVPRK